MKKFKFLAILIMVFFISGCSKEELGELETFENIKYQETNKVTSNVEITIDNDNKILLELYKDIAPITVKNFQKLVSDNFYDGVIFHRVINNFMIQTGESDKETKTIKGEFSKNGVKNDLSHVRGVVSMARNNLSMDSASTQFFIVQKDSTYLDGDYAGFGKVIAGMDVVDKIATVVTDSHDKPIKDITIEKIRFIKVVDNNG